MLYTRIPMERVGVLIGTSGQTKKRLEELSGVSLDVDSKTGDVTIDESKSKDPALALKVRDIVAAIGRGFSEERAIRLLDDDIFMRIFDIKEYTRSRSRVEQLKGRLIGTKGKTRKAIEELTGVDISVYGHTATLVGDILQLDVASRAVEMLLEGSEHSAVYRYLERMRSRLKVAEMGF